MWCFRSLNPVSISKDMFVTISLIYIGTAKRYLDMENYFNVG